MTEIESDPSNEVVEVALGEGKFNALNIIRMNFKSIDNFKHQEEGRRRTAGLLVFLFGKFPVSHDIPDNLILVDGRFFKFFILKVDDLKESEHIRF